MRPIVISIHDRPVNLVKFNHDGDLFYTASSDSQVAVFWTSPLECLGTFYCQGAVKAMDITQDNKYLIVGNFASNVFIFEALTGVQLKMQELALGVIRDLEINMGGREFFIIHQNSKPKESLVLIYNIEEFLQSAEYQPRVLVKRNTDQYAKGTWGYLNKTLVLGLNSGILEVVDYPSGAIEIGERLRTVEVHSEMITTVKFGPRFSFLITSSRDHRCKLLDPETFEVVRIFNAQRPLNTATISPLMFSEEHEKFHVLVGGGQDVKDVTTTAADVRFMQQGDFEITFYNMVLEREVGSIRGHFGPVHSIDVHPEGRIFITGSEDGQIRFHKLDDEYFTNAFK